MSIKLVKRQIDRFLASDTPEVISIKGRWGIGKTFSWNKFLQEAKDKNKITLEKYSYVSLFGINSIDQLKRSVFANIVSKDDIGIEPNIETFKKSALDIVKRLGVNAIKSNDNENTDESSRTSLQKILAILKLTGKKSINSVKKVSYVQDFAPAIDALSFLSISKTIICIDDLERKGAELSLRDILGWISLLKESKKCKVIILFNDKEENLEEYEKYREKAVDIELLFDPTSEECCDIAINSVSPEFQLLKTMLMALDVKNIRVMKKVERLINLLIPLLNSYDQEVLNKAIRSVTLFSWCHYCSIDGAPEIDYVRNMVSNNISLFKEQDDKNEVNEDHVKWQEMLNEYGYHITDEFDIVLMNGVLNGYFNDVELTQKAEEFNKQTLLSRLDNSFVKAWGLYHDSFEDDGAMVIDKIYSSFLAGVKNITPSNLNATVKLFKDYGEHELATKMIDVFINSRKTEPSLFKKGNYDFFGDAFDSEIINRFSEQFIQDSAVETAKSVLSRIAITNGWNPDDVTILATTTPEEYYLLFKKLRGDILSSYIKKCLSFATHSNADPDSIKIKENVDAALTRIGSENKMNLLRVRKYGIHLNHIK
jgi:hypothetical protein